MTYQGIYRQEELQALMGEERSVLWLGGIGGLLAGVFFILALVTQFSLPSVALTDIGGRITRFADNRATYAALASFVLVFAVLAQLLLLALYRMLREAGPLLAPFGSVLAVSGLVLLAFFSLYAQLFGAPPLADLYVNPATPEAERTTIGHLWQFGGQILAAAQFASTLFLALSLLPIGIALLGSEHFTRGFGWTVVVLGLVGVVGTALSLVEPTALAVGFIPVLIFLFLMGWKVTSMSRAAESGGGD